MIDAFRVTDARRVTQGEAAFSGGNKDHAAVPALCHTTGGGVENRSLSRGTHAALSRANSRRRARWCALCDRPSGRRRSGVAR